MEPVNGFCTKDEYNLFINQVNDYEKMLHDDDITLIKFWFSISKEEQKKRLDDRKMDLLKQWKLGAVDMKAQDLCDKYTEYKQKMYEKTNSKFSPWKIIKANSKKRARLESIRYVLNKIPYDNKGDINLIPNENIVLSVEDIKRQID